MTSDRRTYLTAYRENNKERIAVWKAAYRKKNKERIAVREANYRKKNKERIAARNAKWYRKNKKRVAAYRLTYHQTFRNKFNDMYGLKKEGHKHGVCTCCKEADLTLFGTISHIDGSGKHHRESTKGSLVKMLRQAITIYDPTRFAAECFNCNMSAVRNNGICPHKLSQQKK